MSKNKAAQELGRRGAKALIKKYGKDYHARIRRGEKPSKEVRRLAETAEGGRR